MSTLWTPSEDEKLVTAIVDRGLTYGEAADILDGRTARAVRYRWTKLKQYVDSVGNVDRSIPIKEVPDVFLRACVFDIETMNFKTDGYQDHLVSASFLPLDSDEVTSLRLNFEEGRNDKNLLIRVMKEMEKYDILIGHNIAAYDLNWLNSRVMYYGLEWPKSWLRYDTYQVAKTMAIKSARKSLDALSAYFGLVSNKTRIQKTEWSLVDSPIRAEFEAAMDNVVEHCEYDVLDNRELFKVLWKYDNKRSFKITKW